VAGQTLHRRDEMGHIAFKSEAGPFGFNADALGEALRKELGS
jgi:hypothetical protein